MWFPTLVAVAAVAALQTSQGVDLLVIASNDFFGAVLLLLSIAGFAATSWYFSRKVLDAAAAGVKDQSAAKPGTCTPGVPPEPGPRTPGVTVLIVLFALLPAGVVALQEWFYNISTTKLVARRLCCSRIARRSSDCVGRSRAATTRTNREPDQISWSRGMAASYRGWTCAVFRRAWFRPRRSIYRQRAPMAVVALPCGLLLRHRQVWFPG